MSKFLAAGVAEAIGTFALCFIGGGAICVSAWQPASGVSLPAIAVAHGLILAIAVSATMNVSGGHINPAVTIAMLVTGRIDAAGAVRHIISQLIGGTIGGIALFLMFRGYTTAGPDFLKACAMGTPNFDPKTVGPLLAIGVEAVLTFLLIFAIFGTAVDPRAPKIGGWGIGLTIAADIMVGGPITGAAMNPARTFGTGIIAAMNGKLDTFWSQHWVYWVGPVAGAVVAALVYDKLIMEPKRG